MPVIDEMPAGIPASRIVSMGDSGGGAPSPRADDGTRMLLRTGFWVMVIGVLSLLATETLFGGIGIDGPYSNAGWLAFMFAMMGIPFSLLLLALGGAKWLRNRRLRRQ